MKPLSAMPEEEARGLRALLFDLDDTVLDHGVLTKGAYDALWALRDHGLPLLAVTGRPSGWGEIVARQWPVVGVVSENGAVLSWRQGRRIERSLRGTQATRQANRRRLEDIVVAVREAYPSLELADDNPARITDVTFDIGENASIPPEVVASVRKLIESMGARSIVSSVHLHASFEGDDKASGALRFLSERLSIDPSEARTFAAFVGDSENDAACFSAFRTTIGVANIAPYLPGLSMPPKYLSAPSMGAGFAELAAALIARRAAKSPRA